MAHLTDITDPAALAERIRTLTLQMFEVFNHRNFDDPILRYLAPDFTSTSEEDDPDARQCTNLEDHMEKHKRMLETNPDYRFTPIDCTVQLKDSNRRSLVILSASSNTISLEDNMRVEYTSILKWQLRADQGWVLCSSNSIRGMVSGMGFD